VIGAYLLFGEVFTVGQWLGVAVLLCGIFGLAVYNMRTVTLERETLGLALVLALFTGFFVAFYTTYDAYGIRAAADPFTFLAWFFVIDSWSMPIVALAHAQRKGIALARQGLMWRAPIGDWWRWPPLARSYWPRDWIRLAKRLCCARPRPFLPLSLAGCF
jgi:drug/metabolite transporter (DMT)-like permease